MSILLVVNVHDLRLKSEIPKTIQVLSFGLNSKVIPIVFKFDFFVFHCLIDFAAFLRAFFVIFCGIFRGFLGVFRIGLNNLLLFIFGFFAILSILVSENVVLDNRDSVFENKVSSS